MTTLREAAQQVLEALKGYRRELGDQQPCDAEQALEAALAQDQLHDQQLRDDAERWRNIRGYVEAMEDEICALRSSLRAALAEPVQEPDSPERRCGGPGCDMKCCQPVQEPVAYSEGRTLHWHEGKGVSDAQLYLAPPQRNPVEWDGRCVLGHCNSPAGCENDGECRGRAAPPQRKPLTEEEIDNICRQAHGGADPQEWSRNFARAIERAHGIGGEG